MSDKNKIGIKIRIDENKVMGEVYSYHLIVERRINHYRLEIANTDQMRQIAKALLDKANNIDNISFCPKCRSELKPMYIYFWCKSCEKTYVIAPVY